MLEAIHSIVRITFCFTVRNKNKFNGMKDSIIYYNLDSYINNNDPDGKDEGAIGLFNPYTCSVEEIATFHNWYWPYQVAATQNKVNPYIRYFE